MSQIIPPLTGSATVQFCCAEMGEDGASVTTGSSARVTVEMDGTYLISVVLPYVSAPSPDFLSGIFGAWIRTESPDGTVDTPCEAFSVVSINTLTMVVVAPMTAGSSVTVVAYNGASVSVEISNAAVCSVVYVRPLATDSSC